MKNKKTPRKGFDPKKLKNVVVGEGWVVATLNGCWWTYSGEFGNVVPMIFTKRYKAREAMRQVTNDNTTTVQKCVIRFKVPKVWRKV